ncbi:Nuclear import receptor [Serendipita sp. 401]|nr:Nuclear import receptor [Serendipita sp. 401]
MSFSILVGALQLYNTDTTFQSIGLIRGILGHDALQAPQDAQTPPRFPLFAKAISDTVEKEGPILVNHLFVGLLDHFAPEMMSGVVTTIRILTQLWTTNMQQWIPTVLDQIPVSPALQPAKTQFLVDFEDAIVSRDLDKLKPAISTLQRSVLRAKDRRRPLDR